MWAYPQWTAVVAGTLATLVGTSEGRIWQNRLFSDNMILESREAYDIRPFVSGFGDTPGEAVTVTFGKPGLLHGSYPTTVGEDGTWDVQMNCCDAMEDQQLTVVGESNNLTYTNVACGQVYVCSGQSNMELPLHYVENGTAEIAAADRPNWRLFRVPHTTAETPQSDMAAEDDKTGYQATWLVSTPEVAANFSATCYLTARHINDMLWDGAPFGLIWASWGGTRVEAWSPRDTIKKCQDTPGGGWPSLNGSQEYSALYNGMIHPLTKYSIRGAIWFQGEHNIVTHTSRERYACIFGNMINDWRDAWKGIGDFPFLWAQLAPYTGYSQFAGHGDTSVIRLAQADDLPKIGLDTTGMAVTIDLGDPEAPAGDVHSRKKEEVAYRLALQAMHTAYAFQEGENVSNYDHMNMTPHPFPLHYSGPMATTATAKAMSSVDTVEITFDFGTSMYLNDTAGCDIHRGIDFHGNPIGGECCKAHDTFQLCTGNLSNTTELVCTNATSVSIGPDSVTVSAGDASQGATAFTSVRYAYANYPQCALYNKYGLPAGPFVLPIASSNKDESIAVTETQVAAFDPPASTPPMGLNSWNAFHCNVDERKMRAMADALVSTGLAKSGYEFVNIDDCWQVERSPNGSINADPTRFPGGIKALADYIHSIGLKFGVYTAQKTFTCQRRPGSYQHEAIDVESYCDWGVDYLKIDACFGPGWPVANQSWINFRAAIDKCASKRGYPIVMSVESCDDPDTCGQWIGKLANLWRTGGDIQATFQSVLGNAASNTRMAAKAGPTGGPLGGGHWNDADMLQVGNIGLSWIEQRSHFSLWVMMASPLLIGSDVSMLTNDSLTILGNSEVTAINQDKKGVQGVPVGPSSDVQSCWTKPLVNGDVAVIVLNTGDNATTVSCTLDQLGITGKVTGVRDLLNQKAGSLPADGAFSAHLDSHDHIFLRVSTA
eukprot:m.60896 g.60896  ORF g.60896 m.60896 type:complete len:942 (-) comp7987_c0_seq1:114-2939(-)